MKCVSEAVTTVDLSRSGQPSKISEDNHTTNAVSPEPCKGIMMKLSPLVRHFVEIIRDWEIVTVIKFITFF